MTHNNTPLRYPGGKQRLTPFVNEILKENNIIDGDYVEPYAGGAGVAMRLLLEKRVKRVHLNDSNVGIYAFWNSVLYHTEEFCRLISTASLNVREWEKHRDIVRRCESENIVELGFSTFYLNRCNRSGVLSGGLIGGKNQDGPYKMDARFSRKELIRRVEVIGANQTHITIENMDAERYISTYIPTLSKNCLIYLDPPYYEKASGLYLDAYKKSDHARLAKSIKRIKHKWILSYDSASEILDIYRDKKHFVYDLQYNAATVYKGKEVFVFSDKVNIPEASSLDFIDNALQQLYVRR